MIGLAMSAINALLRYRERIDSVLSLKEAGAGLPFMLPPAGIDYSDHFGAMVEFYEQTEQGTLILELQDQKQEFQQFKADPGGDPELAEILYVQYFAAAGITTDKGPGGVVPQEMGLSQDMRLAYFVVESHRLSRNPAVTRILLTTADTLLEVAGENAGLFISDNRTRGVVETLLREFAGKYDFDDDDVELIFKRLLGSAVIAAVENRGAIPYDHPALDAFFAAVSDVRGELGDDFILEIFNRVGLEKLISTYLVHVAEDPSFITNSDLAKKVLSETLRKLARELKNIQEDPRALLGVLETSITVAAANVDGILKKEIGEDTLITTVLVAVAREISASGGPDRALFKSIAKGELFSAIYKTVLQTISANPEKLAKDGDLDPFVARFVAGLAGTLSQQKLSDLQKPELIQILASRSLEILSTEPEFIIRNNEFAAKVVGAALAAGASLVKDGLQAEDLVPLSHAAIKAAAGNIALIKMDDRFQAVIVSISKSLSEDRIRGLLSPKGRRDALVAAVHAIAANPRVWGDFEERDLILPLVEGLVQGLVSDPTNLLSGPVMVEAFRRSLIAAARRGKVLVEGKVTAGAIRELLLKVMQEVEIQIGKGIDGENLPEFLERVVLDFLKSPFEPTVEGGVNKIKELTKNTFKLLDAA